MGGISLGLKGKAGAGHRDKQKACQAEGANGETGK